MKNLKIVFLTIISLLIFFILHKFFFQFKFPKYAHELLMSFTCLNFAFFSATKLEIASKRKIWFIFSEWLLGFILILLLTKVTTGANEMKYWILIIIASIIGGILTKINFSKSNETTENIKNYLTLLIPISLVFPLLNYIYFKLIYQKTFYDLSFYAIIPEIFIVIVWQIITYKNLK